MRGKWPRGSGQWRMTDQRWGHGKPEAGAQGSDRAQRRRGSPNDAETWGWGPSPEEKEPGKVMVRLLEQGGMWSRRPCPGSGGRRTAGRSSPAGQMRVGESSGKQSTDLLKLQTRDSGGEGLCEAQEAVGMVSVMCPHAPHVLLSWVMQTPLHPPCLRPRPFLLTPHSPLALKQAPGRASYFVWVAKDCCPETAKATGTRAPGQGSRLRDGRPRARTRPRRCNRLTCVSTLRSLSSPPARRPPTVWPPATATASATEQLSGAGPRGGGVFSRWEVHGLRFVSYCIFSLRQNTPNTRLPVSTVLKS